MASTLTATAWPLAASILWGRESYGLGRPRLLVLVRAVGASSDTRLVSVHLRQRDRGSRRLLHSATRCFADPAVARKLSGSQMADLRKRGGLGGRFVRPQRVHSVVHADVGARPRGRRISRCSLLVVLPSPPESGGFDSLATVGRAVTLPGLRDVRITWTRPEGRKRSGPKPNVRSSALPADTFAPGGTVTRGLR